MKINVLILLMIGGLIFAKQSEDSATTILMKAIHDKQSPLEVSQIIAEGADVNAVEVEYLRCLKPVLRYALDRGIDRESIEIIKMLIDAGADVNAETYNRVATEHLYGMMPLLTYAVIYSSVEIVEILVEAGARDILLSYDSSINFNKTALMIAQESGKTDIIQVLDKIK